MNNVMIGLIKNLKTMHDIKVRYLCCDDARENVDFERDCKKGGMRMEFKYTSPGTPQQNGHVE